MQDRFGPLNQGRQLLLQAGSVIAFDNPGTKRQHHDRRR